MATYTRYETVNLVDWHIMANAAFDPGPSLGMTSDEWYLKRKEADEKADVLLRENLTEEQLYELNSFNHFHVFGSDSGRLYQIRCPSTSYNVLDVKNNIRLCFGAADWRLAEGDRLLSQKIALECFESEARNIANYMPNTAWHCAPLA